MKKGWIYAEKIIALNMLLVGGVKLYVVSEEFARFLNLKKSPFLPIYYNLRFFIELNHLEIILSCLFIFSGVALLLNKKMGWLFGTALALNYVLNLIPLTSLTIHLFHKTASSEVISQALSFTPFYSLQLLTLIILAQKPYRTKYHVTAKTWLFVILIAALLFSEPYILRLI